MMLFHYIGDGYDPSPFQFLPGCAFAALALYTDSMFFEWSAPYEAMAQLAREKERLSPFIRQCMEGFGCIQCGKCGGENITLVNGVPLCTKEAWARRIAFDIVSQEQVRAVNRLMGT